MRWTCRVLAFLLALLPGLALANPFDSYVLALAPTDYWSLSANATDTGSAALNGTCTGTCTYAQSVSTYVGGWKPGTSSSYITVPQTFASSSQTIQIGAWFTTASGNTTTQYLTNQTGSISNSINLHFSDSGCNGEFDVVVIIGGSYTITCLPGPVNDGNPHFFFVQCGSGVGLAYSDGVKVATFTCSFSTPLAASYTAGNAATGYPVLGAMGALMYWANATLLTNWQLQAITSCGMAGTCPAVQPSACAMHAGFQQEWCETWATAAVCNQGGSYPWWAGAIGTYTTPLNSLVGSIATTTTTISSFVSGAPVATQQYLYDNATAKVSGGCYDNNTNITDGTYISALGTGTGGNGTYTTAPSNTLVASEPMQTGNWLPFTYLSTNLSIGSTTSMVVGQAGGAGGSGGLTMRGVPNPMTIGTERILDFYAWFRFSGVSAWNTDAFGFGSQANAASTGGAGQQVFVKFGNGNSPPANNVNFDVQIPVTGDIGNFNVSSNGWHDITLDVNYQPTSAGFVKILVDGVLAFSWSGVTAPSGALTGDQVFFTGQETGVTVDAQAYFGLIGAYAPGGGGPMTLWLP